MHYIRLLRPPSLAAAHRPGVAASLNLVLTITTDLGEAFLCPDAPVCIAVALEVESVDGAGEEARDSPEPLLEADVSSEVDGRGEPASDGTAEDSEEAEEAEEAEEPQDAGLPHPKTTRHVFELAVAAAAAPPSKGKQTRSAAVGGASWRSGMRVLKLDARLPNDAIAYLWGAGTPSTSARTRRICIRAADETLSATEARQLATPGRGRGLILPLWVDVPSTADQAFPHVALRRLRLPTGCDDGGETRDACVEVEEEIGESIARHVWDAGLVAVAFLADACLRPTQTTKRPGHDDDALADALRGLLLGRQEEEELRVLELGSGVGILGIGLAAVVQEARRETAGDSDSASAPCTFLLTDLPEAEERALSNIALSGLSGLPASGRRPAGLHIRYENLDWEDGRAGRFGPGVAAGHPWDLVVLSDCTYNVDMLPALVETLTALAGEAAQTAQKPKNRPGVLLARKPRHASEEALFALMAEHGWAARASSTVALPVLGGEAEAVEIYLYDRASRG